jgi:alkylation response protein AidB-like acyl-CoA dehydrogenase
MEEELRKLGRDFSERALRPKWEVLDAADAAALDTILREAAAAGIFGFAVTEAAGGSGLGAAEYTVFIEEVSRACAGVGALLAAHFAGIAPLLIASGGDNNRFQSRVTEAEGRGEPALFVAAVKEDPSQELVPENIETVIGHSGKVCVLNGVKTKVVGAAAADCFTVLARDGRDGALCWVVVPRHTKGVEIQPEAARLGLKICPVNDVAFRAVEVPPENMVGTFTDRERLLDFYRFADPVYAAVSIGLATEARDAALKYSLERYQGGKTICDHDAIRLMLAEMEVSIRASRAFAHGPEAGFLASAFAAEASERVCLDAIQVHGGYGYMSDFRIERLLRDAKTFRAIVSPQSRRLEYVRGEIEKKR